jgi:hypothetical protein
MTVWIVCTNDDQATRHLGEIGLALHYLYPTESAYLATQSRQTIDQSIGKGDDVLFLGHGAADRLHVPPRLLKREEILLDLSNIGNAGRVVIAVACHSSTKLGPAACSSTRPLVVAYLGWLEEVGFPSSYPAPILEALKQGLLSYFNGSTIGQVAESLGTEFDSAHNDYRDNGIGVYGMRTDDKRWGQLEAIYWKDRLRVNGDLEVTV